ncbi:MAG: hypothetical protein A2X94_05905 [Bdellovibrionales bacterium GWB1_55_8]|nr:MAG: hypothetical protein A2X94_05905 [Bdellovibrionales bacterium GWB1_55_8]
MQSSAVLPTLASITTNLATGWSGANVAYIILLITLPLLLVAAYSIRILLKGRAHFDRVDRQGGSRFLGKGLMEMGYWAMQPLGKLLVFFQVTPNQISWTSLLFGFLAGTCLVFGHYGSAAAMMTVAALLDSLDGMVARMRGMTTQAGEVLDSALDRYVEFFFLGGLAIHYREILPLLILTLIALLGSFMVSYSSLYARSKQVKIPPLRWSMKRPERLVYLTVGAALSPVTIPWLEKIREFPVAIGHPMIIALGIVAVFANSCAIEQLWYTMKATLAQEAEEKRRKLAQEKELLGDDELLTHREAPNHGGPLGR